MKHYCTVPMKIEKNEDGDPYYIYCNKAATHAVANSLWFVCEAHANTMKAEGRWDLIPIEEVDDENENYARRREGIGEMAYSEREAGSSRQKRGCCCQD